MSSFDLNFATKAIIAMFFVPSVHCYFISTSDCMLNVLNKDGEHILPVGIMMEEEVIFVRFFRS